MKHLPKSLTAALSWREKDFCSKSSLSQKLLEVKSQILELPSSSQALLQLFTGEIYIHHIYLHAQNHPGWFKSATDLSSLILQM